MHCAFSIVHYCKTQPNYALCIRDCALFQGAAQLCIVHYELCINYSLLASSAL